MDRLFLGANVLFSAAYREDAPLRRLWQITRANLVTSTYAVVEAERHLDVAQRGRLAELMREVTVVPDVPTGDHPEGVDLPDKDAPILAAALASGASHLITGDRRDFRTLYGRRIGGVLILPPRDYLASLGSSSGSSAGD